MLQQLLHVIVISFICIIWGLPYYFFLKRRDKEEYWTGKQTGCFIFLFFCGLLSIGFISSCLVLLIPLRFNYLLIATSLLIFVLFLFFKKRITSLFEDLKIKKGFTLIEYIFSASCILLFIVLGSSTSVNIDTQIYHLQIIRWTNEYGLVPGLANLYPRLGLGSSWFNLISIFHIPLFTHQNFTFLNNTVTIWFLLWLMNKWKYYYRADSNAAFSRTFCLFYFFLLLYFLFDWQLFRDTANSTSYDFIVTALMIAVISFIAEELFFDKKIKFSFVLIIISFMIISFKLSGLFILAPVFFYLLNFKQAGVWVKSFIGGGIIFFPILVRNYISSGYPLYPSLLSVGHPEWQVPPEMAARFQEYIFYINKFYNHQVSFIFSYEKTMFNWIPFWMEGIILKHKIILLLSCLSLILFFYNPVSDIKSIKIKMFIISLWLMTAGWFFTAPDPRFALGFLLFLSLLPLSFLITKFLNITKIFNPVFIIATLFVLIYGVKKLATLVKAQGYLYHVSNTDIPGVEKIVLNQVSLNVPLKINNNWDNRCFFTPLPCLCEKNPYLKTRTDHIKNGFKMDKPDSAFIKSFNY